MVLPLLLKKMKLRFREGDFVIIKSRNHGHYFNIGETVMISIVGEKPDNGLHCCDVVSEGWRKTNFYSAFNNKGNCWGIGDCEIDVSTKEEFHKENNFIPHELNAICKPKDPSILKNWDLRL